MKRYKLRPGVVLVNVCGENLLVATKGAREYCPYVTHINESAADYWQILQKADTFPEIVKIICELSGKDKNDVLLPLLSFLSQMSKRGYIMAEESE